MFRLRRLLQLRRKITKKVQEKCRDRTVLYESANNLATQAQAQAEPTVTISLEAYKLIVTCLNSTEDYL
jgi:hypothetical protein